MTRSTAATSTASSTCGSESASQFKLPPLAPPMDLFREFWPRVALELKHLMQEPSTNQEGPGDSNVENMTQCASNQALLNSIQAAGVVESPLTGEALLKRPEDTSVQPESSLAHVPLFNRSLAALLNASSPPVLPLATVVQAEKHAAVPDCPETPKQETDAIKAPLSAVFLGDNNVPDNFVFPPGAEFVKSWRMLNDGTKAWPETTVLDLVVGESFGRREAVKVGTVAPGAVIDLWTGELKAPEASGNYVSYWRLNDGQGNMFGHSIWIDITIVEQSREGDSSLASSSIIMPNSAPVKSSVSSDMVMEGTVAMSSPAIASLPRTDDATSDNGSDGSSVSLISIPSSDDDDDPTIWEDSRSHVVLPTPDRARAAMEYVVLYDDSSSDEA